MCHDPLVIFNLGHLVFAPTYQVEPAASHQRADKSEIAAVETPNSGHDVSLSSILAARQNVVKLLEKASSLLGFEREHVSSGSDSAISESGDAATSSPPRFDKRMHTLVTCLMDLSPSLEQLLRENDRLKSDKKLETGFAGLHVSEPARRYVYQIHDKFQYADRTLVERLGEANWQRFTRIRQRLQERRGGNPDAEMTLNGRVEAQLTFGTQSNFRDSGFERLSSGRPGDIQPPPLQNSFQYSPSDRSPGRPRVPQTPREVLEGTPFECFICGSVLRNIKTRVDWK